MMHASWRSPVVRRNRTPPALNGIMSKVFQKRGGLVTCADAGARGCTE